MFIRTGSNKASVGFEIPDDPAECWPWRGGLDSAGYSQGWNPDLRRVDKMHRAVWTWFHGRPPARGKGYELDHTCRNRACVNPDHLELVTVAENRARRQVEHLRRPIPHGTTTGYTRGCRCRRCRQAWGDYWRERRYLKRCARAVADDAAERQQRRAAVI